MRICLIDVNKIETIKEVDLPDKHTNQAIMKVADCFRLDSEGNEIPIYIPRMGNEATKKLCDYIFQKYKKKN
jgi:hypothetical protein